MAASSRSRKAASARGTPTDRYFQELVAQVHSLGEENAMLSDQEIVSKSRLGFIGLGHLGSPIARRLAAKFHCGRLRSGSR